MSSHEQAKSDFTEALYELMAHLLERMKEFSKGKEGEEDLSKRAKELLDIFKKNPELAKEVITKFASENITHYSERFNTFNTKALEEINNIKREIDLSSETGKTIFNSLNYLERIQFDKEKQIQGVLSQMLNLEPTIRTENGLDENKKDIDKMEESKKLIEPNEKANEVPKQIEIEFELE